MSQNKRPPTHLRQYFYSETGTTWNELVCPLCVRQLCGCDTVGRSHFHHVNPCLSSYVKMWSWRHFFECSLSNLWTCEADIVKNMSASSFDNTWKCLWVAWMKTSVVRISVWEPAAACKSLTVWLSYTVKRFPIMVQPVFICMHVFIGQMLLCFL